MPNFEYLQFLNFMEDNNLIKIKELKDQIYELEVKKKEIEDLIKEHTIKLQQINREEYIKKIKTDTSSIDNFISRLEKASQRNTRNKTKRQNKPSIFSSTNTRGNDQIILGLKMLKEALSKKNKLE